MAVYHLHEQQIIPASMEQVWDCISSPRNLKEITPAYMGFEITSAGISGQAGAPAVYQKTAEGYIRLPERVS